MQEGPAIIPEIAQSLQGLIGYRELRPHNSVHGIVIDIKTVQILDTFWLMAREPLIHVQSNSRLPAAYWRGILESRIGILRIGDGGERENKMRYRRSMSCK